MPIEYDKYYQTENLFGAPYPELIKFFSALPVRGTLLDVGCGQGRDAIPLAKLGFEVTGIDHSRVGIAQLNEIAQRENLTLKGIIADIYIYPHFDEFDHLLFDSMFHFGKKERDKETALLHRMFSGAKANASITICIQKTRQKLDLLNTIIAAHEDISIIHQEELLYCFEDQQSGHRSETWYEMLVLRKGV